MLQSAERGNRRLSIFVALVMAGAGALVLTLPPFSGGEAGSSWPAFFLLVSLAGLAGAQPVRVPALRTWVSATDIFVFTAIAHLGPLPACLASVAGVVGMAMRRAPRRRIQLAFNLGNVLVSTGLAAEAFQLAGGLPGAAPATQIWPLLAAASVYLLVNTALCTVVAAIDNGGSAVRIWKDTSLWAAVSAYAAVPVAYVLLLLGARGSAGLAVGVAPLWLLVTFYRTHQERQEARLHRIGEVEQTNQLLEERVAERTRALQDALAHLEGANVRLRLANEQLIQANRAKSEFLANVSHELRTPLNAVIGFSDLLRDASIGPLNEQQAEYVGDIYGSGEHLLGLINGILDLSKIEAGKMEVHTNAFDPGRVIAEAVSMLGAQAAHKAIELSGSAQDGISVLMDEGMFRRILINLVSNAVKFTPAGGRVSVAAACEGSDLVVQVEDSGIGIAPEHHQRIFEEFFQVDGSSTRSFEGTGLGLALVRKMVELHGGEVVVASELGQGARFTCRFPGLAGAAEHDAETLLAVA